MTDAIARLVGEQRATEFDAVEPGTASETADPHPQLAGYRVTDLSAAAGAIAWLAAVVAAASDLLALSTVELFVSLAVLVLVPLGLGLAATARRSGGAIMPSRLAAAGQLPAALAVVGALAYGYSAFPETGRLIDIGEMIRWHGTLNAFGFALPALLAVRRLEN